MQQLICALNRFAGTDRATIEFSTEEFAADALKLNSITLISFEVLLLLAAFDTYAFVCLDGRVIFSHHTWP
jgi:hypothetical protein